MTLNLIEALKTPIYNPKHTNNTKMHDQLYIIFLKKKYQKNNNTKFNKSAFYVDSYGII